jgi:hypothetical protein
MEVVENQILSSEIKSMTYLQDGKLDKMPVWLDATRETNIIVIH